MQQRPLTIFHRENSISGPRWTGVRNGPLDGDPAFMFFFFFSFLFSRFSYPFLTKILLFLHLFIARISIRVLLQMFPPQSVLWCPDDMGRDGWDWVGPPTGREHDSCPRSGVWRLGTSPHCIVIAFVVVCFSTCFPAIFHPTFRAATVLARVFISVACASTFLVLVFAFAFLLAFLESRLASCCHHQYLFHCLLMLSRMLPICGKNNTSTTERFEELHCLRMYPDASRFGERSVQCSSSLCT